jgi:hypothetical protein
MTLKLMQEQVLSTENGEELLFFETCNPSFLAFSRLQSFRKERPDLER